MIETYQKMNVEYFFNRFFIVTYLTNPSSISAVFPDLDHYFQTMAINFGLTSLLQKRTPREMIEGYKAPLYQTLNSMELVKGGDKTLEPFMALSKLPTRPLDNKIALFTGEDQYNMTRTYGQWMNQDYIIMNGTQYTSSLYSVENYTYSPWAEQVAVNGTDGLQFTLKLSTDDTLFTFSPDLCRNLYFTY